MSSWRLYPILLALTLSPALAADTPYAPPASPRQTFNFNPDWKFIRQDVPGADNPAFDDSAWTTISTPHTYNETDTFNRIIVHSGGQQGQYLGLAWYRKHFKLPSELAGRKVFLEFEGLRQAAWFYLNGKPIGLYENGVTAYGIDVSKFVNFGGDQNNVLAVKVDNSTTYKEQATGTPFQWNVKDFNPVYGGINRHVWLHVAGKVYQTLPLYDGLQTQGIYIYPSNFSIADKTCDVNVEAEVKNESGDQQSITLSAVVVDAAGKVCATLDGNTSDLVDGQTEVLTAAGPLKSARWWDVSDPYLYDVYSILTVNGQVVDVCKTTTGFRKAEFRGGAGTGGVYLNDHFIYLKGYSQRSSDEWAGLGQAYPDWMHDLTAKMVRDSHANYIRWMHITPQAVDVRSCDRFGIIEVCPAGDKEADAKGRQWDQRVDVMRDSIIYMRNHPSILFWEAGNTVVSPAHMQQMVDLRKQWDPSGGRVMGTRGDANNAANSALTPVAEYYGVMIGQAPQTDALKGPTDMFRAYSAQRRDRAPLIESEDFRDEAARRFWDDYSPPHFGFKPGPKDTYHWNSETFAVAAVARYWAYWANRISNTDPRHSKWSGYASIYFSDSNADGRQDSSEVCRVSGKVDAVRLPKEAYYAYRVMQNDQPDLHIIGHWSYPAGTVKDVYVVSNCPAVELVLNGTSIGTSTHPIDGYLFTFPKVAWRPGTLRAVGISDGNIRCSQDLRTAGSPARIKLTPITAPSGLMADGADVALVDVEVVDEAGLRCPTDEARIDFTCSGPGVWRGGYNSGKLNTTNNLYLDTECGINRVSVRSTMEAGAITITARRPGLAGDSVRIKSHPVAVHDGIEVAMPSRLPGPT